MNIGLAIQKMNMEKDKREAFQNEKCSFEYSGIISTDRGNHQTLPSHKALFCSKISFAVRFLLQ